MTDLGANPPGPSATLLQALLEEVEPPQDYPRGTVLYHQGDDPHAVFILSRGLVKDLYCLPSGHEIVVGIRSPGWPLGACAVLLERPYPSTPVTLTPCCAYRLSSRLFLRRVRSDGSLSWFLHRAHAEEIGRGICHMAGLACLPARQRMEQFFEELARDLPETPEGVEVPLRDWEIAQLIAVTPTYLSRLMAELADAGHMRRDHRALILTRRWLDRERSG